MIKLTSLTELSRERVDTRDTRRAYLLMAVLADVLLLAIQLTLCARFAGRQISDAASYMDLSQYCAQNGTWYPNAYDQFAYYVFGNGYINIHSLCRRLALSVRWEFVLNVVFTQVIVLCTADIATRLTGRMQTGCIAMTMVCLMGGIWGEAVQARTELCFMAFAMLSLCCLMRGRGGWLLLSGALFALANWVRPLLVVFLPGMLFYMIFRHIGVRRVALFFAGLIVVIALIGFGSVQRIGKFVYQAQTMGVNMLMGANDDADGSYQSNLYDEGSAGHIPDEQRTGMTFDQYDAEFKRRAMSWILDHPVDFLLLAPAKLFYYLATDTYGGSAFFDNVIETDNLAYLLDLKDILLGKGKRALAAGDLVAIWSQVWYMAVFLLYAAQIVSSIRRGYILDLGMLHIIFLLSCGVAVMTVGAARYHMPYLPIFAIGAAVQVDLRKRIGD